MFGKVSVVALASLPFFGATHTGDLRQLYNEMYPVSALTRDAFTLCHESEATFIRALEVDRERCLDHMPHSFAVAIGHIRPDSDLAAWAPISDGARAALLFAQAATLPVRRPVEISQQLAMFVDAHHAALAPACAGTAPELSAASAATAQSLSATIDLIVRRDRAIDDTALAGLLLSLRNAGTSTGAQPLPLVSARMIAVPAAASGDEVAPAPASPTAWMSSLLPAGLQQSPAAARACSAPA